MNINSNFSKRVVLSTSDIAWEDSPMKGVTRRRLDRVDNEADRVTTIVKYASGSRFSAHEHKGGEEIFVLSGVFEDEYGDWPAGSYIRNPPTSKHKPGSKDGCIIFVKLAQFQENDRTFVHIDINKQAAIEDASRTNVKISPLFKDEFEDVRIEYWKPNSEIELNAKDGAEFLVLEGSFEQHGYEQELKKETWLRQPINTTIKVKTGPDGAKVWVKSGHLRNLVNG